MALTSRPGSALQPLPEAPRRANATPPAQAVSLARRHVVLAAAAACAAPAWARRPGQGPEVQALLTRVCGPLVQAHDLPGLVAGLLTEGRPHFAAWGHAARSGGGAVTPDTIFELGSISKCFTTLLAAFAQTQGRLGLEQPVGQVVRALHGTPLGQATLLHLATYTAGGLPLQFPDGMTTADEAIDWLAAFEPTAPPGAVRRYSNPSIGLLGHAAATAMGQGYAELCEHAVLAPLGLASTFIEVPPAQMHRYAWGHDRTQRQVRVNPGVFDAQAYGVKSTARDLLRFLHTVLDPDRLPPALRPAMATTTQPRCQVGPMQQGMGWEMYPAPWSLDALQDGNSARTVLEPLPVTAPSPQARDGLLLNKTGSTSGFGAYVALLPHRQTAFVLLANRHYPAADRVRAAHQVLAGLGVLG